MSNVHIPGAGGKRCAGGTAEKGSANDGKAGMLYNAACAYSLTGGMVTKAKP
ncbi:MAG: hypothetical protein O3A00_16570 [Planctomycetota bacterium]|nr:hypothetical protein [Planctomycetota bacterium]